MERIKTMCDLAWSTYSSSLRVGQQLSAGYVIRSILKGTGGLGASQLCFYAVNSSGAAGVIACSGSNDRYDWISNFMFTKREWPEVDGSGNARFHAGTLNIFQNSVQPWVDKLQLAPTVALVGHSLGGMTAQCLALYLHYVRERKGLEIFTFGTPFIGNAAAAKFMVSTRIPAVLLSVEGDGVPTLTMPYMITGYAPWGKPSASAVQRAIVLFGDDVSARIGYRYDTPAYALPTPRSFTREHTAYLTVLRNIVSAAGAQRCTYSALAYHADKAAQCAGSKALCVKSNVSGAVPCGSAGFCNLSNHCYTR